MERYVVKDGKKLKYGYTTGSCATAAAKAASRMLVTGDKQENVKIRTPKGWDLFLDVEDILIKENKVKCSITKDSGDDPDSTHGIKVFAEVEKIEGEDIILTGGIGVGKVTEEGLATSVGEYAINPVPRKTILAAVKEELPQGKGVKITISIPQGVDIAKKTFNPRLGIVGGISVLGTSGIVEPMSEEAFKDSIALELKSLKNKGIKKVIFSPGNYGRDFACELNLKNYSLIKTSNFIGFMLDKAIEYDIEEILFIGHIGKMIKVAGGIFHTHSKVADARMEILASQYAAIGGNREDIKNILNSITTDKAIEYIKPEFRDELFKVTVENISKKCMDRVYGEIKIGTVIFSKKYGLLGICNLGKEMLAGYKDE
ncbi:MAG: cobalt-precorrin-5B (C(1))-methyltransferase CbiD [Senegalia sp. (in: firmicutes)]|uniref:cobalt-precorrin-5B (C(1))-methyltransferase CbiD n=1 Tax=Senegalia sp. (in: firmicutes) TaxID=1924098 RepID=UPI003F9B3E4E